MVHPKPRVPLGNVSFGRSWLQQLQIGSTAHPYPDEKFADMNYPSREAIIDASTIQRWQAEQSTGGLIFRFSRSRAPSTSGGSDGW